MARRVEFTVADSASVSDWVSVQNATGPDMTKLGAIYTPAGTPNGTLGFTVRDANNAAVEYPAKNADGTSFTITVNGIGAYGFLALETLSSLVEGKQWRLDLGAANSSGNEIKIFLEFS